MGGLVRIRHDIFCVSVDLIHVAFFHLSRRGWFGRAIVAAVPDCSQDPEGAWRRRFLVRLPVSG